MALSPTYPGVYIQELPSAVHTITGVATSITAFIGRTDRGPTNQPVDLQSYSDYEANFGGLSQDSTVSFAVQQFFMNGGSEAYVVRVINGATAAGIPLACPGTGVLALIAANEGSWGNLLWVRVDQNTRPAQPGEKAGTLFNLWIRDSGTNTTETYLNVSVDPQSPRFISHVLKNQSQLVIIDPSAPMPAAAPNATSTSPVTPGLDPFASGTPLPYVVANGLGTDGSAVTDADIVGDPLLKTGIYSLDLIPLFNLLCIPPIDLDSGTDVNPSTYSTALAYCKPRRAMLLIDPPSPTSSNIPWAKVADAVGTANNPTGTAVIRDANTVMYFPWLRFANPLKENRLDDFPPSGAVAGIIARIDSTRGVWKSPAGQETTITGVQDMTLRLTEGDIGKLNPLGINCLRLMPVVGPVVWGARTLNGADQLADQWKYLSVRRLALYIEESLYESLQWAVFEPNDEPLWAELRLNVGAFMADLFRKGAFEGSQASTAYLVKCDSETTTQNDINNGIVNILVGFQPLLPAEFVIIQIQQLAGNVQS